MPSQSFMFHDENDDEEGGIHHANGEDDEDDSPPGSPREQAGRPIAQPSWPQSYRFNPILSKLSMK